MGKLARAFILWKYLDVEIENVNFGILLKEGSFLKLSTRAGHNCDSRLEFPRVLSLTLLEVCSRQFVTGVNQQMLAIFNLKHL